MLLGFKIMGDVLLIQQVSSLRNSLQLRFARKHLVKEKCLKGINIQILSLGDYNSFRVSILVLGVCVIISLVLRWKSNMVLRKEVANAFLRVCDGSSSRP